MIFGKNIWNWKIKRGNQNMAGNRDFAQKRYYRVFRQNRGEGAPCRFSKTWSFQRKAAEHFKAMCEAEKPIVFPEEKITFTRTNNNVTPAYSLRDNLMSMENIIM